MHSALTGALEIKHFATCKECGPLSSGPASERNAAVTHTKTTGHETASVRVIVERLVTDPHKVSTGDEPGGFTWPDYASQGWTSGTGGVADGRP